jgi:sugar O-acyltransferase (sialic acid O-acetyltransferase NeuD family)
VVLFGVGSPIVVDVEESLARAGITVHAAVRNRPCESYLLDPSTLVDIDDLPESARQCPFLTPMFTPAHRQIAAREAESLGFHHPFTLADPTAVLPRTFSVGNGVYINAGCTIGSATELADYVFINRGASLGHHARLGRFVSIGPGVVLAGAVTIHAGAVVGAGAVVLPKVTVGTNAVVGAGSVVTRDVPDHCLVLGNPARIVKQDILGYADLSVT